MVQYPENHGSRKILARSWNLGNVSTESQRLIFVLVWSEISLVSGADFQTRPGLGESWILPFTTPTFDHIHGICTI